MFEFFESAVEAIYLSVSNLFLIAILFLLFALLIKGSGVIKAIRESFSNSVFNITLMSLNVVLLPPIVIAISQILPTYTSQTISALWNEIPQVFVIFFAVFFGDFIGYWRHRFEHSFLLWPSHATHHSDTQMNWLTLQRFHPFNRVSTYFIDSSFLVILGFPPYAIIANSLIRHYYGYFIHADLPWTYGAWGKVFVSPVMHRWHHALEYKAHNTNYATVFSFFDLCFGTYRVPSICNVPLGVSSHSESGLLKQLLYPLKLNSYNYQLSKPNKKINKDT